MDELSGQLVYTLHSLDEKIFGTEFSPMKGMSNQVPIAGDDPLIYVHDIGLPELAPLRDMLLQQEPFRKPHFFLFRPEYLAKEVAAFNEKKRGLVSHELLFWQMAISRIWMKVRYMAGGKSVRMLISEEIYECLPRFTQSQVDRHSLDEHLKTQLRLVLESAEYHTAEINKGKETALWNALLSTEARVIMQLAFQLGTEEAGVKFLLACKACVDTLSRE